MSDEDETVGGRRKFADRSIALLQQVGDLLELCETWSAIATQTTTDAQEAQEHYLERVTSLGNQLWLTTMERDQFRQGLQVATLALEKSVEALEGYKKTMAELLENLAIANAKVKALTGGSGGSA